MQFYQNHVIDVELLRRDQDQFLVYKVRHGGQGVDGRLAHVVDKPGNDVQGDGGGQIGLEREVA